MIRCEICKKSVFDVDKNIVNLDILKSATSKGFIPSYYIEREKEGIEYGLPRDRKWKNILEAYSKDSMDICRSCFAEVNNVLENKTFRAYYCFIATAAYGSTQAYEVELLKNYRDEMLLQSKSGRLLVNAYNIISPPIAKIISNSETLKAITRKYLLKPIIRHISRKS